MGKDVKVQSSYACGVEQACEMVPRSSNVDGKRQFGEKGKVREERRVRQQGEQMSLLMTTIPEGIITRKLRQPAGGSWSGKQLYARKDPSENCP